MSFPFPRPKSTPAKSAPINKPNLSPRRYGGFQIENQEVGRASTERRKAISKAAL